MSKIETEIARLNQGLSELDGVDVSVEFNGRPSARVLSLDPLRCEKYGHIFNRGPRLMGRFAVVSLLVQELKNGEETPSIAFEACDGEVYTKPADSATQMNEIGRLITSNPDYGRWIVYYEDDFTVLS